ncbi:MAG: DUF4190 domain-containing protein [Clostridia bacterium]|nr:DUF4190 domain-containing protein [Clostridia bacterium]
MADDRYDPNKNSDNWDEAPKINWDEVPKNDWSSNQTNGGGSNNNYYRRYTPPTDGGPGNGGAPGGQPQRDADGSTSKILGIVGLIVNICVCQIAGIVLGIIGFVKARKSARDLGYETSDAATGRVLGIVNIVLGVLMIVLSIAMTVFYIASGMFDEIFKEVAGEGVETFVSSGVFIA